MERRRRKLGSMVVFGFLRMFKKAVHEICVGERKEKITFLGAVGNLFFKKGKKTKILSFKLAAETQHTT